MGARISDNLKSQHMFLLVVKRAVCQPAGRKSSVSGRKQFSERRVDNSGDNMSEKYDLSWIFTQH